MIDPSVASLVEGLAYAKDRQAVADQLAQRLGAQKMFAFVPDAEIGVLVPAPGFPQSLPGGTSWPAFLRRCATPGRHQGEVEYPDATSVMPITAWATEAGPVFALAGGSPRLEDPAPLQLPLLGALLQAEHASVAARGSAAAAQQAVRHATALAAALDATRAELERALRLKQELLVKTKESEARKAAVLKTALDAIITIDHAGRVLEFSSAAERMFGCPQQDAIGNDLFELIFPPAESDVRRKEFAHQGAANGPTGFGKRVELTARRRDGALFPIEFAVNRVELDGLPTFTTFIRDITETKRVEGERERLLGIVGHDLRNPLQAIIMGTSLLLARGSLSERDAQAVGRIHNGAQRMSRMIADLLDFERSRQGRLPISRKPGQLASIIRQLIEEFEVAHPTRRILFQANSDGAGSWDPDRISQLISNLIGNSLQHSPPDATVELSLSNAGSNVLLQIRNPNRDAPLNEEELHSLFEPFRRGRASSGLGLGLFIVRQIALAHGGEVSAASDAEGTSFRVLLPRDEPRAQTG